MAEKLFLQLNDFQDNGKTAFGNVVQLGKGKDCAKICKVCGKEGQATAITNHIEANHLDGVSVPCNLCEKILGSRAALRTHISRYHKNIYWYVIFQDKECPEHRNTETQKDRSLNIYWDHHPPVLNSFAAMTIATMIFAFTKKKHKHHFSSFNIPLCIPFYAGIFSVDCSFPDFYVSKIFKIFKKRLCCRIKVFLWTALDVGWGETWNALIGSERSLVVAAGQHQCARGALCCAQKTNSQSRGCQTTPIQTTLQSGSRVWKSAMTCRASGCSASFSVAR